jgi:enoyl-CoA hydratase
MIEVAHQNGVAVIRMSHGKANAMSLEFCERLTGALQDLRSSPGAAIVLTGSGAIFSAGVDLLRLLDGGAPYIRNFLPALAAMLTTVFSYPKPVVAAINGHAIAGGCVLACAADKRLMGREAGRIGVTELLVGVPFPAAALEIMRCATAPRYFEETIFSGATPAPGSAMMSHSLSSRPIESRTTSGPAPACTFCASVSWRWVVEAGWMMSERVSPILARCENSFTFETSFTPAS